MSFLAHVAIDMTVIMYPKPEAGKNLCCTPTEKSIETTAFWCHYPLPLSPRSDATDMVIKSLRWRVLPDFRFTINYPQY